MLLGERIFRTLRPQWSYCVTGLLHQKEPTKTLKEMADRAETITTPGQMPRASVPRKSSPPPDRGAMQLATKENFVSRAEQQPTYTNVQYCVYTHRFIQHCCFGCFCYGACMYELVCFSLSLCASCSLRQQTQLRQRRLQRLRGSQGLQNTTGRYRTHGSGLGFGIRKCEARFVLVLSPEQCQLYLLHTDINTGAAKELGRYMNRR